MLSADKNAVDFECWRTKRRWLKGEKLRCVGFSSLPTRDFSKLMNILKETCTICHWFLPHICKFNWPGNSHPQIPAHLFVQFSHCCSLELSCLLRASDDVINKHWITFSIYITCWQRNQKRWQSFIVCKNLEFFFTDCLEWSRNFTGIQITESNRWVSQQTLGVYCTPVIQHSIPTSVCNFLPLVFCNRLKLLRSPVVRFLPSLCTFSRRCSYKKLKPFSRTFQGPNLIFKGPKQDRCVTLIYGRWRWNAHGILISGSSIGIFAIKYGVPKEEIIWPCLPSSASIQVPRH